MADELIPLSSLLGEDEETQIGDLIPLSSLIDQSVKRVPTAMDRGVDVPLNAQVQEPARDLGFFGRTRERFNLGFEQGDLDQEAYRVLTAGGQGIEEHLKRRRDFQRRASAADIRGDNVFTQGLYGAAQMVGPMVQGVTEGLGYGLALGVTTAAAGQLGPQVAIPEEIITVPGAAALGTAVGGSQYWYRQGAGSLYADLRAEGVPHNVAAPVSQSVGLPYALIEYAQVSKAVPGMKRIIKQKIMDKVKGAMKRNAVQFGSDVVSNVGQEVAQEITMAAGEAVAESVSDVGMEGTPLGERLLETTAETMKAMPFILAPGRAVKTAGDVSQERKVQELNDFLSKGNTDLYRDRFKDAQVQEMIAKDESLKGLQGHNGRVLMFERVPEFKEGEPQQGTVEYIKVEDTNSDLTTLIEQHETANPDSYFRGAFDLGTVEVAEKPDSIETRLETEATVLGDGVLDPVRLGKHRVKAQDVQTLLGGEINESETGYEVKLDNGIELKIDFTEMEGDVDVQSYLSETGMEQSEWDSLSEEEQQDRLKDAVAVGAFTKNTVIDDKGNEVAIPDSYLMQLGAGVDIGTFRHEAIHFLRETGLMTEKEFQTLVSKYSSADRDELRQEEDVARAYEYYVKRGGEDGIFQRIYDKFTSLVNIRSAASVLRRVNRGEIARRDKPVEESGELEAAEIPLPDYVQPAEVDVADPDVEPSTEIKYSVQDKLRGVNVRNESDARFADLIVDGKKTVETRNTDSLRAAVGQRIRITRTGEGAAEYIGEATVGEPIIYGNEQEFRADASRHMVQPGSGFDIQPGGIKYGYPMLDAERYSKPVPAPRVRGRVMTKPQKAKQAVRSLETPKFREGEQLEIEGSGSRGQVTIDDVGKALEEYSRATTDEVFTLETDRERMMAQAVLNATDEATYQLQQPDSGVDWYEKDMRFTEKSLMLAYPELKQKPKMVLFKAVMAPTSFGNNPVTNMGAASRIYEMGQGDFTNMPGRQPGGKGWTMRANATDLMINRLNKLVKDKGERGAAKWLLSKHPIKELREYHSGVSGKMDDLQYGAYIFGPKGGPFFLNLNGVSQELTKDMWFTRAWNRVMGTVLDESGEIVESPRNDAERAVMDSMIENVASELGLTVSEFQAVWWYYEQQLWKSLGASVESYSFAQGAERLLKQKGIQPPRIARGRDAAAKRRQAAIDAAISRGPRKSETVGSQPRQSVRVSPKARERINVIEGYESIEAEDVEAQNTTTITAAIKGTMGRKSRQILYFGGQGTLRAKQKLLLDESYAARAVRLAVDELHKKLVNDAWNSQTGQKLPKWFRVGAWANRLKKFYKLALPIAAHLNAIGRNKDGTFNFTDFEMRAGLMPIKEFKKQGHKEGDTILVKDEVTGELDELTIANHVVADGRQGYQLIRKMGAEQQGEIYDHFAEEFPDLIWAVDQFIDPALKDTRTVINGVEVPAFNRFSLEYMMVESDLADKRDPLVGVAGYTPDVIVSRSLVGALKGMFNPRAGTRSPGRKYKTGTAREGAIAPEFEEDEVTGKPTFAGYTRKGGDLRGLFEGFTVRAYQAIREKARREYAEAIFKNAAKPIPKGEGLLPNHVRLSTGIDSVWDAIKAFQNFHTIDGDTEVEKRLSKKSVPSDLRAYSKFMSEARRIKGKEYQIDKRLIKLLEDGYAAEKVHGMLFKMGAWAVRNSTQMLLAHPFTYVINVLSNDLFTVESIAKHGISGLLKLGIGERKAGADDLRLAKNLFTSQFYKFAGIRRMTGWKTGFDRFVDEVMPDDVFEGSTAIEDLKVQMHVKPWEYLRQGEIGAAALQLMQYGNVDLRAKQRATYAFLKSKAVRAAKEKGLKGEALKREVDSYMARPPKLDRIQAMELADFDYLNYSDSPSWLQTMAANDYSRLLIPFPRFGYHYMAKQIERATALKRLFSKIPKGRRADAFADLATFGLFTLGGAGWVIDKILSGGEDDEEARKRIGTATYKYIDPVTGEMKSKRMPRELITANRINLSEYARLLGIDDDDDSDFWWRARQFPPVVMGGAMVLAEQDAKQAGITSGIKTYSSQGLDLLKDFFTLGGGIKVVEKLYVEGTTEPGDRAETMMTDPYATNVPLSFYITDQAMTSFIPGRRQFDDVMMMIDPTTRKKTRSKKLGYEPGAMDAIRLGHASGVVDRLLNKAGLTELPMPQGTVKDVAKRPVKGEKRERRALRAEAKQIIAEGRPQASEYRDRHGNLRLGLIPEATQTTQPRELQALKLGGFNIRRFPRANYEDALQPPEYAQ